MTFPAAARSLSVLDSPNGSSVLDTDVSVTALPTSGSAFTSFDLSSFALQVFAGTQLTIALSNPLGYNVVDGGGCNPICWLRASAANPYAGGSAYVRQFELAAVDYGFPTWVEPATSVPEPGTLALLSFGLGMLGLMRRRLTA